ncbi:hypothetical protein ACQ4PT_071446 [Festuca glaucescens]
MDRILERYERFSLSEGNVVEEFTDLEGSMNYDHIKLTSRIEALQKSRRNLMGEQLDSLTAREVQQLEQQIGNALRNIRIRKNHLLTNSIAELQNKERMLMGQNKILEKEKAEVLEASLHNNRPAPFCNNTVASLPNLNICEGRDTSEPGSATTTTFKRMSSGGCYVFPLLMLRPSSDD